MQYVSMKTFDIRRNLATEQYLMNSDKLNLPVMLFYIEDRCVIVGRNQNTIEEVDQKYCRDNNIMITRRLSGGGAMYQDLGNLCFSFIVDAKSQDFGDFKKMVAPIVNALHEIGATGAMVTGRNDIIIDGKKFSGNAMYTRKGKTFSHGTLMLDVDTSEVAKALTVPPDKIESKGIKSVRSRVTNLRPYLAPEYQNITTEEFRDLLICKILNVENIEAAKSNEYLLSTKDERAIDEIEEKYYSNWDWVFGKSPKFTIKRRKHFTGGTVDVRILVEKGRIESIKFYGDFFGTNNVSELENELIGCLFDKDILIRKMKYGNLEKFFQGIPEQDIIDLIVK